MDLNLVRVAAVLALALAFVAVLPTPAVQALPEEEHQDDPPDCIALWDPFCPGTPGGGPTVLGCYFCAEIPEGPDGEPGGWLCAKETSGYGRTGCVAYENGCTFQEVCLLA